MPLKFTVLVRTAADTDLRDARDWYERQRPGLGNEFLAFIAAAFTKLEQSPYRPPVYYRDFRRLMLDRFPYKLFYRVIDENVIIFRVLHAAREHTSLLR